MMLITVRYCPGSMQSNVFAVSLHHGHLLKASVSCSFFSRTQRIFSKPLPFTPSDKGANVILSLKLLTCFFPLFLVLMYLFICACAVYKIYNDLSLMNNATYLLHISFIC